MKVIKITDELTLIRHWWVWKWIVRSETDDETTFTTLKLDGKPTAPLVSNVGGDND